MVNVEDIGVASENCLHANDVWKLDNLLKDCIAAVIVFAYEVSDIITPNYRLMLPLHPPSLEKLCLDQVLRATITTANVDIKGTTPLSLAPRGTQRDRDDNVGDLNLPAIDGLCISVIDVAVHHTYGQDLSAHLIFADGAVHQFDETEIL
ncbi:uncharacterized protein AtWU_10821 [Aspergillus tubingensis]|uniref:uncharacterized protein n=1 Tax=Aspergillus tubingensis TaxID=5068 RepID=UPI001577E94D|nr:uncharacterized protein AtWU_10821 [Aspergillus tubingensis]GFN21013.1 hypothetical protein AtWU_10821 [Aspergillus tubingensis]